MEDVSEFEKIFQGQKSVTVKSHIVGQRINIKAIKSYPILVSLPFAIKVSQGVAVLFRYGVVVLIGLSDADEAHFLEDIKNHITSPVDDIATEDVTIIRDPERADQVSFEQVCVARFDMDRLLLVADILAKSQVLAYYEAQISKTYNSFDPIANEMQKKGGLGRGKTKQLTSYIGATLSAQRNIIGQVEVLDKPDFLWDQPLLEGLYLRLEDEFELRERNHTLKEKLDLIYKTADVILDTMNTRHALRVEWYITVLIIFEIVLHFVETYVLK